MKFGINATIGLMTLFSTFGCASSSTSVPSRPLRFDAVSSVRPGIEDKNFVEKKFGRPEMIVDSKVGPNQEGWLYIEGTPRTSRASFIFDKTSGKVVRVNWFVHSREPELDLKEIHRKFPNAKFVIRDEEWPPGRHFGPNERYYEDEAMGLKVTTRKSVGDVESITWKVVRPSGERIPSAER